jgi:hypothetical protein
MALVPFRVHLDMALSRSWNLLLHSEVPHSQSCPQIRHHIEFSEHGRSLNWGPSGPNYTGTQEELVSHGA